MNSSSLTSKSLMLKFESLGDNCEFGLVQRRVGAEPLSLMRFTAHRLPDLRRALRERFAGFSDHIGLRDDGNELITVATSFGMQFHTFQQGRGIDTEEFKKKEQKRLGFLARKLLRDLEEGEKIFVRKSNDPPTSEEIEGLWSDLQDHGPNTLLWVTRSDDTHCNGSVEVVRERLLRGYMRRFAPYENVVPNIDHASWATLCRKAYRAHLGQDANEIVETELQPSEPFTTVRADNGQWLGDLLLGSNGRLVHSTHQTLASYYLSDDILHVRWDVHASELYIEQNGIYKTVRTAS